jgi:hypothetical protein
MDSAQRVEPPSPTALSSIYWTLHQHAGGLPKDSGGKDGQHLHGDRQRDPGQLLLLRRLVEGRHAGGFPKDCGGEDGQHLHGDHQRDAGGPSAAIPEVAR